MDRKITSINYNVIALLYIIIIITSCSSWKHTLKEGTDINDMIYNAIEDFINTNRNFDGNDIIYDILIEDINQDLKKISIVHTRNKLLPGPRIKINEFSPGSFPTRYIIKNEKLFYWYDPEIKITEDIVKILNEYNHIDSINVNGFVTIPDTSAHIDDGKPTVNYFFCKNNIKKYRKTFSSIELGYDVPIMNCE